MTKKPTAHKNNASPAKKIKLAAHDFAHLHNHTQYSLLDGLTKVPELLEQVKKMGMQSVAVTDHGTLSGLIEFYKEALAQSIRPVLGMETYVAARSYQDKDPSKDKNNFHLILLAMNNEGYQNLMRLSSIANLEGFYYKPRIDHKLLEKYNQGLIVLSGCIGGEVGDALRQGQYDTAKQIASWYKKVFGDRYYLEIQDHGHPDHPSSWQEQQTVNEQLFKLGEKLDIGCVLTCDAHYLSRGDKEAHEILLCVQTGSFLSDANRMSLKEFELHLTDPKEIIQRWGQDHPEIITNTRAIAERCAVELELGKILRSSFPVPTGENEQSYLHRLVYRGLACRYAGKTESQAAKLTPEAARKLLPKEVRLRADYELGIIDRMGFEGYFLIVQDFINWGKDRGIIFGPGRGSGAASIVAYGLRITEIEPLEYGLLFERFLNPDRISMPDFDIDIQDSRRDEVIRYCVDKYGSDRVANIVTFGRMAARNAVRDVARVLQVPYGEADRLAKMLPPPAQGRYIALAESLRTDTNLKQEYRKNEQAKKVFDLAVQLEGTIRSHGVHAAGVVIAPDDIVKFTPLEMAQKGVIATQYAMGPIDELGLLKIDFLGLSNLTIINNALRIIRKVYQKNITLTDIPKDDQLTYELLQRADTTGVFQLESSGMKRYLRELKPTQFDDIIAMVSLYRPGPMQEIPRFIEGKNHPASVHYLHKSLEPILKDTYGVMVYQEQIIKLLQLVAGYTPGEADLVRKAIGKKKRDIMKAEEPKFIEGCLKQGLNKAQAEKLWAQIQPFADYSFNKAHATCYAQIAFWTAYLKAHYPTAFMAALMTSDYDNTDRLAIEIAECKHMGIRVLPPDANESFLEFAVVPETNQIRFGMAAIKNVGTAAVEEILRARELDHGFVGLEDFFSKVNVRIVNRKAIESLVKAGAFDSFENRSTLLHNLDALLAYANRIQRAKVEGQTDLFGNEADTRTLHARLALTEVDAEHNAAELLGWERELLGIYLSRHPLDQFEAMLAEQTVPISELSAEHDNRTVTVGGAVSEIREVMTRNGKKMAFVKMADKSGEIELILFPGIYEQHGLWERDRIIIAKGKITSKDRNGALQNEVKIILDEARELSNEEAANYRAAGKKESLPKGPGARAMPRNPLAVVENIPQRVYLRLDNSENQELLLTLKRAIDDSRGDTEVVLVLGEEANKQVIKLPMRISKEEPVIARLKTLLGEPNVKLH